MTGPVGAALVVGLLSGVTLLAVQRAVGAVGSGATRRRLETGAATSTATPMAVAPAWFAVVVGRLELTVDADRVWPVTRAGSVLAAIGMVATVPGLALVVVVAAAVALVATPAVGRRRHRRGVDRDLPAAVEAMAAELATGASLAQAVARVSAEGAPGVGLAEVVAHHRRGGSIQSGLDRWADDHPGDSSTLVADAVALAGSSGGSQAEALRGAAVTLRERQALQGEVAALSSQAQASAAVLVAVPVAFAALVAVADASVGRVMVATPLGWGCVVGGLGLDAVGAWWMHRLTVAAR